MFLLDTDHLVILQRQSEPEYGRLNLAMSQHAADDFFLSIVSFHEQSLGASLRCPSPNRTSRRARV